MRRVEFKLGEIKSSTKKELIFLLELKKGKSVMEALRRNYPPYYDDMKQFPLEVREEIIKEFRESDMSVKELFDKISNTWNELFLF
jgi:late competence protein required for DNA uptake (superfamily II DNA/RNA helicase)